MNRMNYLEQVKKLDKLSQENDLSYRTFMGEYPLRMTVQPYTGVGSQLSLMDTMETRGIKPGAVINMSCMGNAVTIQVSDRFTIGGELLNNFAKTFQKLCTAWFALVYEQIHEEGSVEAQDLESIDQAMREG